MRSLLHLRVHEGGCAERRFLAIASLCSLPPEAVHALVMKDDRVLANLDLYAAHLPTALTRLAHLPDLVWVRCARVVDIALDWRAFRHEALMAACTAAGYSQREVFDIFEGSPWWITQGDVQFNLDRLEAMAWDDVTDETLVKIKYLLQLKAGRERLVEAVHAVRDSPCTINTVEQAHSSGAHLNRMHEYGLGTLSERMMLHKRRALFSLGEVRTKHISLQRSLDRLLHKDPSKVNGWCMFFKNYVATRLRRTKTVTRSFESNQTMMREAGEEWAQAGLRTRARWDSDARRHQNAMRAFISAAVKELEQQ